MPIHCIHFPIMHLYMPYKQEGDNMINMRELSSICWCHETPRNFTHNKFPPSPPYLYVQLGQYLYPIKGTIGQENGLFCTSFSCLFWVSLWELSLTLALSWWASQQEVAQIHTWMFIHSLAWNKSVLFFVPYSQLWIFKSWIMWGENLVTILKEKDFWRRHYQVLVKIQISWNPQYTAGENIK